jgi:phosphoribosylformimino-5-aminoimidazole carboxamide ribotide isomerase
MHIIPAIDIFGGQCVRLVEGDFSSRTQYSDDPAAMAAWFRDGGARALHVVDLEGAKEGRPKNWPAIERILAVTGLSVQVGGGIRTEGDIARVLDAGASRAVVGSAAIRSPETVASWAAAFGPGRLCVALDLRDGALAHSGWLATDTIGLADVVRQILACGVTRFLSTDIRRDGRLTGPNVPLYARLVREHPGAEWIASGGVTTMDDIRDLERTGVFGAVIGKAVYEGRLSLRDLFGGPC